LLILLLAADAGAKGGPGDSAQPAASPIDGGAGSPVDHGDAIAAAKAAALAWLALIDDGKYRESWSSTADVFKRQVDQATWQKQIDAVRTPLGKLVSRASKSARYATSLPGAADGEYVVLQFNTSFDKKKVAVETVTPMKDTDGHWRVSGYFIR
jgi:hypothetical protein